jgi:acylphosphatase
MITSKEKSFFQIKLDGSFRNSGIGFLFMKKALEVKIVGQLKYTTDFSIQMLVVGDEPSILDFYQWCIQTPETTNGSYLKTCKQTLEFTDFMIINTL